MSSRPSGKARIQGVIRLTDAMESRVRKFARDHWAKRVEVEAAIYRRLGLVEDDVALASWACRHRLGLIEGSRGT